MKIDLKNKTHKENLATAILLCADETGRLEDDKAMRLFAAIALLRISGHAKEKEFVKLADNDFCAFLNHPMEFGMVANHMRNQNSSDLRAACNKVFNTLLPFFEETLLENLAEEIQK